MKGIKAGLAVVSVMLFGCADVQSQVTPFKLGSFAHDDRSFVGIVLDDTRVIDLARANDDIRHQGTAIEAPVDMRDLITRYDAGLRERIQHIIVAVRRTAFMGRPDYVHDLSALKVLPPVRPQVILNMAGNYAAHILEVRGSLDDDGNKTPRIPGVWEPGPDDHRGNPYMFLKASTAVIAHGEVIRLPPKRYRIDYECELAVVIGRRADHVPYARADDYIFGYTIEMDISDREDREDGRSRNSDWLMGKSHETFAPLGQFIVPKEFIADPHDLDIHFALNGEMMQDANTELMIHNVYDQVVYASNILTLRPGDILGAGTPGGVGDKRNPPVYLQDGDRTACTYEGIGTLENTVVRPGR